MDGWRAVSGMRCVLMSLPAADRVDMVEWYKVSRVCVTSPSYRAASPPFVPPAQLTYSSPTASMWARCFDIVKSNQRTQQLEIEMTHSLPLQPVLLARDTGET